METQELMEIINDHQKWLAGTGGLFLTSFQIVGKRASILATVQKSLGGMYNDNLSMAEDHL